MYQNHFKGQKDCSRCPCCSIFNASMWERASASIDLHSCRAERLCSGLPRRSMLKELVI